MLKQLMSDYFSAYNAGDEAGLTALLAPEVTLVSDQGAIFGRAAYLDLYRQMTSLFIDQMTPLDLKEDDDRVRVQIENTLTARNDIADFMGMSLKAGGNIILQLKATYRFKNQQIMSIEIAII